MSRKTKRDMMHNNQKGGLFGTGAKKKRPIPNISSPNIYPNMCDNIKMTNSCDKQKLNLQEILNVLLNAKNDTTVAWIPYVESYVNFLACCTDYYYFNNVDINGNPAPSYEYSYITDILKIILTDKRMTSYAYDLLMTRILSQKSLQQDNFIRKTKELFEKAIRKQSIPINLGGSIDDLNNDGSKDSITKFVDSLLKLDQNSLPTPTVTSIVKTIKARKELGNQLKFQLMCTKKMLPNSRLISAICDSL